MIDYKKLIFGDLVSNIFKPDVLFCKASGFLRLFGSAYSDKTRVTANKPKVAAENLPVSSK
ncbi:hypothetical protein [Niallia nealsonii]|uniref:Uncharacterized protein n=1 Tax=Niallia nealsonii TaxID=115979 RepID=A0A2N0Z538_9BACI|nr:hypothetical protein [Niallia nealsonii]PKG24607.1 hypothetical protein CWS01_04920 [Niallia nealsonii]